MKATITSVLLLLVTATSASAECAWVLWHANVSNEGVMGPWWPVGGHETLVACRTEMRNEQEALKRNKEYGTSIPYQHFRCLPDTIDARGPKGK